MRRLRILSLDLDWFNWMKPEEIPAFVDRLVDSCWLPRTIAWMKEHHYLYPWTLRLLKSRKAKTVSVVNIDEHHDFYGSGSIDDYSEESVSCGNFFAFMAHDGILTKYVWAHNGMFHSEDMAETDLESDVCDWEGNNNKRVEGVAERAIIKYRNKLWPYLRNKEFDAFAVIESPEYTDEMTKVRRVAKEAFRRAGFQMKYHKLIEEFKRDQRKKIDMRPLFRKAVVA